jgi:hypothetical protein
MVFSFSTFGMNKTKLPPGEPPNIQPHAGRLNSARIGVCHISFLKNLYLFTTLYFDEIVLNSCGNLCRCAKDNVATTGEATTSQPHACRCDAQKGYNYFFNPLMIQFDSIKFDRMMNMTNLKNLFLFFVL